jgi:hypothetical protein
LLSFFFFVLAFLSILYLYILCPLVTYCSTTHNTNIRVSGGIRTPNPSKRAAADPRLKPFGLWDWQDSIPALSSPWRVEVPTELSGPTKILSIYSFLSPTRAVAIAICHFHCLVRLYVVGLLNYPFTALLWRSCNLWRFVAFRNHIREEEVRKCIQCLALVCFRCRISLIFFFCLFCFVSNSLH